MLYYLITMESLDTPENLAFSWQHPAARDDSERKICFQIQQNTATGRSFGLSDR